jgi:glycosyltransferase involved in cell wall biosynthesis
MIENKNLKVLVELRPALDGHAGIPQETRLLFGALSSQEDIELEGLLQTAFTFLPAGIIENSLSHAEHEEVNRFSKIVIALSEQTMPPAPFNEIKKYISRRTTAFYWLMKNKFKNIKNSVTTTKFFSMGFEDFIWRRIFDKTLSAEDFDAVTKKNMRIASVPWGVMQMVGMWSAKLFSKASFPPINLGKFDVLIAQTPYPGRISGNTKLVVRYHDAVPMFLPHTIGHKKKHQQNHYQALRANVENGAYFACVSDATRNDLLRIFPEVEARAVTIHNMISHHYYEEPVQLDYALNIIRSRVSFSNKELLPAFTMLDEQEDFYKKHLFIKQVRYLLMVSTLEPRKNHQALIDAWQRIRLEHASDLKLILVGNKGWGADELLARIRPFLDQGQLFVLNNVPTSELRVLYRNAVLTVCPSFAEGFDYSGVEAMQSAGIVLASDIPVHREIYANGALYFNPYNSDELRNAICQVLNSEERSEISKNLLSNGRVVSAQYRREILLSQWRQLLVRVADIQNDPL